MLSNRSDGLGAKPLHKRVEVSWFKKEMLELSGCILAATTVVKPKNPYPNGFTSAASARFALGSLENNDACPAGVDWLAVAVRTTNLNWTRAIGLLAWSETFRVRSID